MACKSCGASKRVGRFCAYCRNPSTDKPEVYYVDVSNLSIQESRSLIDSYRKYLDSKLDHAFMLLPTPTHGRMMSV